MKSVKEIQTIANRLAKLSLDTQGNISIDAIKKILHLIENNDLESVGLKVENTQKITLLKKYYTLIKNLKVEDSIIVTTAIPVKGTKMLQEKELKDTFGKGNVTYEIDKNIIAGVKIQTGWSIIDNTIKNTLDILTF